MAGNKINIKNKGGRDDRNKFTKSTTPQEENEDLDFAMLRKPIMTNVTGFAQARKIFDLATEELKDLLSNECDLLYECKVCRNIFRSLANLISHKRIYCTEKFKPLSHGHFIKPNSILAELKKIKRLEEGYLQSLRQPPQETNDEDNRIPASKDLTNIIEKLTNSNGVDQNESDEVHQLTLQTIPNSSVAVFQSSQLDDEETNSMLMQVQELDDMLSQDQANLGEDGNFTTHSSKHSVNDNVIQISDEESVDDSRRKCDICDMTFSTMKTLRFHMKYKHNDSRLVYPCPDCMDIFSTSWSVYRHLFKIHRKSAAQIRRLRESIQAKAFKMNNPPASYEKRKNMKLAAAAAAQKLSEEEKIDQENQVWMEKMEWSSRIPRCGGCGRSFERRAALAAHTAACPARGRALSAAATAAASTAVPAAAAASTAAAPAPAAAVVATARRIQIQVRRDYNKTAGAAKHSQDENAQCSFKSEAEVVDKSQRQPEDDEMSLDVDDSNDKDSSNSESPEKIDEVKPEKPTPQPDKPKLKLLFTVQAEKISNNLTTLKQKMAWDIDVDGKLCKKCNTKMANIQSLCDHMATKHYNWYRYACKLCNYKDYYFDKLTDHIRMVHKMKGDSDFYYSTVKAIDGNEALELYEESLRNNNEKSVKVAESRDKSPDSRRPSRCSSDSSRLSDDNSNHASGSRKRKMGQANKNITKKKKEDEVDSIKDGEMTMDKVISVIFGENDNSSKGLIDENSSELDEDDKTPKKMVVDENPSVALRRPVRRRTKPKNYEDFEYDLSNLLKMEAQGYREAQASLQTAKTAVIIKKKISTEKEPSKEVIKEFSGALLTMSKKSWEVYSAHMRPYDLSIFKNKETRTVPFVRPILTKVPIKTEKSPPKKSVAIETVKTYEKPKLLIPKVENETEQITNNNDNSEVKVDDTKSTENCTSKIKVDNDMEIIKVTSDVAANEKPAAKKDFVPVMVPVNFRRQSLEVANNPLVKKNITDLTKSGMKTKILVIKPINKNKDITVNPKLKFQTIKLKDPKSLLENSEVKVVKVPSVSQVSTASEQAPTNNCVTRNKDVDLSCKETVTNDEKVSTSNENIANNVHDGKEKTDETVQIEKVGKVKESGLTEAATLEIIK